MFKTQLFTLLNVLSLFINENKQIETKDDIEEIISSVEYFLCKVCYTLNYLTRSKYLKEDGIFDTAVNRVIRGLSDHLKKCAKKKEYVWREIFDDNTLGSIINIFIIYTDISYTILTSFKILLTMDFYNCVDECKAFDPICDLIKFTKNFIYLVKNMDNWFFMKDLLEIFYKISNEDEEYNVKIFINDIMRVLKSVFEDKTTLFKSLRKQYYLSQL